VKKCRKCNIEKPLNNFEIFKRNKDGYHSYCKECKAKLRKENIEKIKLRDKNIPDKKECSSCHETKNKEEFDICSTRLDGLREYCKECRSRKSKKRFQQLRERDIKDIHSPDFQICGYCKIEKPIIYFHKAKTRVNGYHSYCSECVFIKRLAKKYNCTVEKIITMRSQTNCEICEIEFNKSKLNIDHSHFNGNIRGVLCENCNWLLGNAKDNLSILKKAIDYLKKYE